MAKNLFEVVQSLFIPFVLLGMVSSRIALSGSEKIGRNFFKSVIAMFIFVLFVSFLREKRLIKYNQINNIFLLCSSIILGVFYYVLLWLYSIRRKNLSKKIETPLMILALAFIACLMLYKIPLVFSLPFHFLGMYDTYFSTMYLAKCTGYLLGILVCFLSFWTVHKVLSRSSLKVNKIAFTAMYLVSSFISFVAVVGIINSYYRRKIKIPTGLRKSLPQLITAENIVFFASILILAIVAVGFFVHFIRIHGEYANSAERRKLKAFSRNNRRWGGFLLFLCAFVFIDMTVIKKIGLSLVELSPSEEFQLEGNEIFIPLEQVSDGHLHRFTWINEEGKGIRFIIVQKKGSAFGVGFDACDVCGDVGYYERKNDIVCNRCDVVMNKNTIGLKGGCNPVPLFSRIENGGIVILTSDLQKEAHRFKN